MIDIHSHILPGIDDGARDFDDSLEIIRELAMQGVTDIIATPHFVDETRYMSKMKDNLVLLNELREKLASTDNNVNVFLGNEIYINDKIVDLIDAEVISPMAESEYLLVELPLNGEYQSYEDIFADLMGKGYKVILAHPERYSIVHEDYQVVRDLYDMGVLLQCNIGSINGKYGKSAQKTLKKLAKDKMIFAFGSDIHHPNQNDYIKKALKKLSKYYNVRELEQVLVKNPQKILG